MLRTFLRALVLVPLTVLIVAFAVANRQRVVVSFDPFDNDMPAYALSVPLFVLILSLLIVGVVIGGMAAWARQNKWRRAARRHEARSRALQLELDAVRERGGETASPPPARRARLTIPPPAA